MIDAKSQTISCTIPSSLHEALAARMQAENESSDHIVSTALSQYLGKSIHTLFQVSTSAALVEGLYQGAVRVSRLLEHGDFGLGTFIDLNGEMAVLDGLCYQVSSTGAVNIVEGNERIPYAVVTRFSAEFNKELNQIGSFSELVAFCDGLRKSENVFYAFRIDGEFISVKTRVMKPVSHGTSLKTAAAGQQEFELANVEGTLVGIWSPKFASSFTVPGYHFHFLSKDRKKGGHVLECKVESALLNGCAMNEIHVSLPETEEFLKADLTRDPQSDLASAERNHEQK
jgi:acetolactate decarboxylase